MSRICLLISIASVLHLPVWGQRDVQQELQQAFSFQKQGKFEKVVAILPPLLKSSTLTPIEKGQTWTVLGFAYQVEGDFGKSHNSYEQALRILVGDERYAMDYAIALENFANLYKGIGQHEDAIKLETKALHLFEGLNSNDGIARSCVSLAGLELGRKKLREGEQYLAIATKHVAVANGLDEDFYADFSSTKARYDGL